MRGTGLNNTVKYRWIQQPNKLYTIFSVPIFQVRESVITNDNLLQVLKNINALKETGYYSRVHIGHHLKTEEHNGAGYIDNPYIKKGVLYADIVEIPQAVFAEMQGNKRYPYLSVEYLPDEQRITTVALLESQPPYFKFPLLDLQDKPDKPEIYEQFSLLWEKRTRVIAFQEKGIYMADNEEKVEAPVKDEPKESKGEVNLEDVLDAIARIEALLQEHDQRLQSLMEMELDWHKKGEPYSEKEKEEEEKGPKDKKGSPDIAMPSSVAFSEVLSRLAKLEKGLGKEAVETKLKGICEQRGLNFSEQNAILCKFSSQKDKEVYLDALASRPIKHSVSNLQKFSAPAKTVSFLEQKYEEIVGNETNEDNLRKFQAIWGKTPAKFVEFYSQYPEKLEDLTK